jgi:hypothetical protein
VAAAQFAPDFDRARLCFRALDEKLAVPSDVGAQPRFGVASSHDDGRRPLPLDLLPPDAPQDATAQPSMSPSQSISSIAIQN